MQCPKCGATLPDEAKYCAYCGTQTDVCAVIEISGDEALNGCQKELNLPGLAVVLRFNLKPGMTDGQILKVNNARFKDENGEDVIRPLKVTIRVVDEEILAEEPKKRFRKWWIPLAALLCILFVGIGIAAAVELFSPSPKEQAQELIPYFEQRYFLSALEEEDLETVCAMYRSITEQDEYCELPRATEEDKLSRLIALLQVECPELFQVDYNESITYYYYSDTDNIEKIKIPYRMSMDEYKRMRAECENVINSFVSATEGFSERDKEKYVFDHIASNCWYDLESEYSDSAYGVFVENRAKCDGITYAMKWAMDAMGIQCLCITADDPDQDMGHAWNIVKIDGVYYVVDLTMSVHNDTLGIPYMDDIIYCAFNVSDWWVSENYVIHERYSGLAPIPSCDVLENSYYAQEGVFVYSGEDPSGILERELEELIQNGGGKIFIQFEDEADLVAFVANIGDKVISQLFDNGIIYTDAWYAGFSYNVCMISISI